MSGTPIQNKLADLYGLIAFLGCAPLHEKAVFTSAIERPIKQRDVRGIKRLQVGGVREFSSITFFFHHVWYLPPPPPSICGTCHACVAPLPLPPPKHMWHLPCVCGV